MRYASGRWLLFALLALLPGCALVGLPGSNVGGCYPCDAGAAASSPEEPPLTRLVAMGDFGTDAEGRNANVATALSAFLATTNVQPERVFELGDNFYYEGLIGTGVRCGDPPAAAEAISDQALRVLGPFEFLRDQHITMTAIPGNHDYGCGELGLANQVDMDRWLPPQHRWGKRWEIVSGPPQELVLGGGTVQVILLDSHRMITERDFRAASAKRLEHLLAEGRTRFRWRVLAAHHPLRTWGTHDGAWWQGAVLKLVSFLLLPSHALAALHVPPFEGLSQDAYAVEYVHYREAVEAAVARAGAPVTLFLAGHDHQLQLLAPSATGQPYVLISGSAAPCSNVRAGDDTLFAAPKNGFAVVTIYPRHLDLDFIGTTGCDEPVPCAQPTQPRPHLLFRHRIQSLSLARS